MVVHNFNLRIWELEAGRSETLSRKTKDKQTKSLSSVPLSKLLSLNILSQSNTIPYLFIPLDKCLFLHSKCIKHHCSKFLPNIKISQKQDYLTHTQSCKLFCVGKFKAHRVSGSFMSTRILVP